MRTCKAVGRGRSLDRGEEVASVVAGAPPPFTEGLPCMTSHTRIQFAQMERMCFARSIHLNHAMQLLNVYTTRHMPIPMPESESRLADARGSRETHYTLLKLLHEQERTEARYSRPIWPLSSTSINWLSRYRAKQRTRRRTATITTGAVDSVMRNLRQISL